MKKLVCTFSLVLVLILAFGTVSLAANVYTEEELLSADARWDSVSTSNGVMTLNPGKKDGDINFCWMTPRGDKASLRISKTASAENAKDLAVASCDTLYGFCRNTASATGLEDGSWYYSFTQKGVWSEWQSFTVSSDESFEAIFVSDSQIGRSGESTEREVLVRDFCGWEKCINTALAQHPNVNLLISGGDQVEDAGTVSQYRAFAAPASLRNVTVAPTVGNHEFYMPLYSVFNYLPASGAAELLASPAGRGYYFSFGCALFVVFNSNNMYSRDAERLIKKAKSEFPDAQWLIGVMHHSCYSAGSDENDTPLARRVFVPLFEKYSFDLVLSGHDHLWSRAEVNGVHYLQAGSGSGSKMSSPNDPLPSYVDASFSEKLPTYSVLSFSPEQLVVTTFVQGVSEAADEFHLQPKEDSAVEEESFFTWLLEIIMSVFSFIK